MDTKKPVRYAQCWVFGGTLTSSTHMINNYVKFCIYIALRTIGIPARPITNFDSAHDADFNRAIDYYFDKNSEPIPEKSGDSVW